MTGKGSVNHNSRRFHAKNTDPERSHLNVTYCNENIKDVYHELFDEALARYNEKQTRSDRRIGDYYEKIRSGRQEKPFHEIIIQIGDKDTMGAETENGSLAAKVLDDYMQGFRRRNFTLRVFSAYLHMDEATPHLHIDFVPYTTGSRRGLDTRVSLKQALSALGFKGGTRQETELNQWVAAEKEQLAAVMERHGIEWEKKGTHEKHLSVLDFEKRERAKEVKELEEQITEKRDEFNVLSERVENYDAGIKGLKTLEEKLDYSPEYQLPEPPALMTAKAYKSRVAEPLVKKLKSLMKAVLVKGFEGWDNYYRLNVTNRNLYRENERLVKVQEKLADENRNLRRVAKEYRLLRKALGGRQVDFLLEQAKRRGKEADRRER